MSIIEFDGVSKEYKLFKTDKQRFLHYIFKKNVKFTLYPALNNVSLRIEEGQSIGLLGRNGAGKSTLLKLITGVTYPTKGSVKVNGQVSALLELTSGFDSEMTGRENIYLKGYILGLKDSEIKGYEDEIIAFADIDKFIDQPVRTYSSGMKARLGFAVNVCIKPKILIIDEALSVGDAMFARKCKEKVREIVDGGATLLFVSHDVSKVKDFCDDALIMEKGEIKEYGKAADIIKLYEKKYAYHK